jgi:hypothetical protein
VANNQIPTEINVRHQLFAMRAGWECVPRGIKALGFPVSWPHISKPTILAATQGRELARPFDTAAAREGVNAMALCEDASRDGPARSGCQQHREQSGRVSRTCKLAGRRLARLEPAYDGDCEGELLANSVVERAS